jgi:hypothetical protein
MADTEPALPPSTITGGVIVPRQRCRPHGLEGQPLTRIRAAPKVLHALEQLTWVSLNSYLPPSALPVPSHQPSS